MCKLLNLSLLALTLFSGVATNGFAQQPVGDLVALPQNLKVIDDGPRDYRFDVEYITTNAKGATILKQRISGVYTRGLRDNNASWKNIALVEAMGAGTYGIEKKREFMEGFKYANNLDETFQPEFFKDFPADAVKERNLVWDTGMFELFGQEYFEQLKLNTPHHILSNQDVNMPNLGTFTNRDVVLEWVGISKRNSQDCALIQYEAFLNPLKIENGGMSLQGRSDYWGQIWVSLKTKQIEYATLREVVVAELKLPGQDTAQVINVFRKGDFQPTNVK